MNQKAEEYMQKIIQDNFWITLEKIEFSEPPKKDLWDLAFWGFWLARDLKKNPMEIVTQLKDIIEKDMPGFIDSLSVEWPYLNIFLSGDSFFDDFMESTKEEQTKNQWTIIVDYIWANVWKPLHIGHMCTPNQGQALINIYKDLWYTVIWDSHIGDWGIIFGKLITAYKRDGVEESLHQDAVGHLFDLYVDISRRAEQDTDFDEIFRKAFKLLSEWDKESVKLWSEFTKYSIASMNKQLARINVAPDYNIGESFYEWIGLPKMWDYPDLKYSMSKIVDELIEKWIATKNEDNSVGVEFDDSLKIPSCILQKRDGTHGYLASDLATIKYRMVNWDLEKVIYSVDVRQQLHFKQAFYIAHAAWWTKREDGTQVELVHAYNGFISLKDGAMSTRKWRIIRLDDLLDEAEKRAQAIITQKRDDISTQELQQLGEIIWIGAIKYGYLKKWRETDVVFDWDEFMTFEWNSGPYIQYAYVRAKRVLEKYDGSIETLKPVWWKVSWEFTDLMMELMKYREVIEKSALTYHPHILAQYCYTLARAFNAFYNSDSILQEEDQEYKARKVFLVNEFARVLKRACSVLGIEVPEKM